MSAVTRTDANGNKLKGLTPAEDNLRGVCLELIEEAKIQMKKKVADMLKQNGIDWKKDGKDLVLRGTTLEYKGSPIGEIV